MPCHMLSPRIKQLSEAHPDRLTYEDVDIAASNPLGVMGTPHIIIKKDGEEIVNEHVSNPAQMLNKIRELIQ